MYKIYPAHPENLEILAKHVPMQTRLRFVRALLLIFCFATVASVASLPYFYFDCGTEDAPLIFPFNRELAALMFEKKIPHEFRELPGDHSWGYWDRCGKS